MIPETISRQNVDGESMVVEETVRVESATRTVETATTDSPAAHEQGRTGSEKTLSRWRPLPSPSSELLEEHLRTNWWPVVGDRRHRLLDHQVQRGPRVVQQHREHPVEAPNAEVTAGRLRALSSQIQHCTVQLARHIRSTSDQHSHDRLLDQSRVSVPGERHK